MRNEIGEGIPQADGSEVNAHQFLALFSQWKAAQFSFKPMCAFSNSAHFIWQCLCLLTGVAVFQIKAMRLGKRTFFFLPQICVPVCAGVRFCMCGHTCVPALMKGENRTSDGQCHVKLLGLFCTLGRLKL